MGTAVRKPFRVVFGMNLATPTSQRHLRGVLRFAREHPDWTVSVVSRHDNGPVRADWSKLEADGAFFDGFTPLEPLRREIRRRGLPVVASVAASDFRGRGVRIQCDNESVARLAADHLASRGFSHFGFVGEETEIRWSRIRLEAFRAALASKGFACAAFPAPPESPATDPPRGVPAIAEWLAGLPKPVAVFAAFDLRARQVLDACREAGLAVPDDVAVIGVDDDPLLCETADPPLSSVAMDVEDVAYAAAAELDAMMRNKVSGGSLPDLPEKTLVVGAVRVAARASTARFIGRDRLVAKARALVETGTAGKLAVSDLARELGVSRRTLETRFRAETGRSVGAAVLDARLARAKDLLRTTTLPHEAVAAAVGICSASHMASLFRRRLGARPSDFRGGGAPRQPSVTSSVSNEPSSRTVKARSQGRPSL